MKQQLIEKLQRENREKIWRSPDMAFQKQRMFDSQIEEVNKDLDAITTSNVEATIAMVVEMVDSKRKPTQFKGTNDSIDGMFFKHEIAYNLALDDIKAKLDVIRESNK